MTLPAISMLLVLLAGPVLAQTTFTLDKSTYDADERIVASWTNGPGSPTDWVGIYPRGIVPSGNPASTIWLYVNGSHTATVGRVNGSVTFTAPGLPSGQWSAHFLANDGYSPITGKIDFEVLNPALPLAFVIDPIRRIHGEAGQAYSGKLGAYARTGAGGLSFAKLGGPAWLQIDSNGTLAGTPGSSDVGVNEFTIEAADGTGATVTATLRIEVFAPGTVHLPLLKVLSFNIWVGASRVSDGPRKGLDSILLSDADLVAVSENNGRAAGWASELGWHVYESGSDNAVLSRYPLVGAFTASSAVGARVRIADSPRREVILWACHLTAYPYGPYDARDAAGNNAAKVAAALAAESNSGRLSQINNILAAANAQLAAADATPVLLLGDFNCPSHLDWTPATATVGRHFGLVVDWPVTRATEAAGLLDAYRLLHPDPVTAPGETWTPIDPADVQDRIDMVHSKGASLAVRNCRVFTTIPQGRWPSDHAGVLAEFAVAPVDQDADGLGDAWEVAHFSDTVSQDAGGNPDHDLATNFAERGFGTNPNDPNDPPSVREWLDEGGFHFSYRRLTGGVAEGSVYAAQGIRYHLELSGDLESWLPAGQRAVFLESSSASSPGIEHAVYQIDPSPGPNPALQFVRIRLEAQ